MGNEGIVLDRNSRVPLQRQLETTLREAILSGRLEAGERILSSRELRTHLGLSRNTIVSALSQLHAEGYLVIVRGVGTFVAETVHSRLKESRSFQPREREAAPPDTAKRFLSSHALAGNLSAAVPFRPGIPALDLFPAAQFRRGFKPSEWTPRALDYPSAFGHERLREAIVKRLAQTRGIACNADHVLITSGAQAAFNLIARVLLKRNDDVIVEEPGYPNARAVFLAEQSRITAVPVDDDGIIVTSLAKSRAKLIHVTPSHQYPTGAVLSLERRFALLDWAARHDAWIIEDDYDSEFNYTGKPQPALHSLDGGQRVMYVGTFSKVLSPALRIAYVVVPRSLRAAFEAAQQVTGGHPSSIIQNALATFMENGHFGRHITKMRKIYDERRRFASSELARRAGSKIQVRDSRAGLQFIASLPKTIKDTELSLRAAERGIIVPALSNYFHGRPTLNGIVIGYAAIPTPITKQAVALLCECF